MTTEQVPQQQPARDPLHPEVVTPKTIRECLFLEDRAAFDEDYRTAQATARDTLELTELHKVLESWRCIALLQRDPEDFRRLVRRAAELLTGKTPPDDEPLSVTRAKVCM
jgi:hypothetical protein